jgi:hypothetical protein
MSDNRKTRDDLEEDLKQRDRRIEELRHELNEARGPLDFLVN